MNSYFSFFYKIGEMFGKQKSGFWHQNKRRFWINVNVLLEGFCVGSLLLLFWLILMLPTAVKKQLFYSLKPNPSFPAHACLSMCSKSKNNHNNVRKKEEERC